MYEKLDSYLLECSGEKSSDDYWYDIGVERACEMLESFTQEDWKTLKDELDTKSLMWRKRLIYCLGDNQNCDEIEIIMHLINTEDEELFVMCIDALREIINKENSGEILSAPILERVAELIPKSGVATKKILENFLLQFNA